MQDFYAGKIPHKVPFGMTVVFGFSAAVTRFYDSSIFFKQPFILQ
jgi:hypothetical protein